MQENYFKRLLGSALASLAVLIFLAFASAKGWTSSPWLALLSMLPLFYYHRYLASRAVKALSQSAIDSVYYFGFLITVTALAISALSIAMTGAVDSVSTVVSQFAIGLIATGYAVVARMHLTACSTKVEDASPEAIMDQYIKKSLDMVDNVEMASVRLADFSTTMMTKTSEITESARMAAEKAMLDVVRVFQQEMQTTLSSARDGIAEIRAMVSDTSFTAEREQLAKSIKTTIDAVTGLNRSLEEMAARNREGASATQQLALHTGRTEQALSQVISRLDDLAGSDAGMVKAAQQLAQVSEQMQEAARVSSLAVQAIGQLGKDAEATAPAFKSMTKVSKKVHDQLEILNATTERMGNSLATLEHSATVFGNLATQATELSNVMPAMTGGMEKLSEEFVRAGTAAHVLGSNMVSLPDQSETLKQMSDSTAAALKQIADQMAIIVEQAGAFAAHGEGVQQTSEAARRFTESTDKLQTAIGQVEMQLRSFPNTAANIQRLLLETTEGMKTALKESTNAIEADARRSSSASTMLTESLTQVAKTIVEQTRLRQGASA